MDHAAFHHLPRFPSSRKVARFLPRLVLSWIQAVYGPAPVPLDHLIPRDFPSCPVEINYETQQLLGPKIDILVIQTTMDMFKLVSAKSVNSDRI